MHFFEAAIFLESYPIGLKCPLSTSGANEADVLGEHSFNIFQLPHANNVLDALEKHTLRNTQLSTKDQMLPHLGSKRP